MSPKCRSKKKKIQKTKNKKKKPQLLMQDILNHADHPWKLPLGTSGGSRQRCPVCRKVGGVCEHYEYDKHMKKRTLIRCCVCKSLGDHWFNHCPNRKPISSVSTHPTECNEVASIKTEVFGNQS